MRKYVVILTYLIASQTITTPNDLLKSAFYKLYVRKQNKQRNP